MDPATDPRANIVIQVRSSNDQNGFLVDEWLAKAMRGKPMRIILLSGEPARWRES